MRLLYVSIQYMHAFFVNVYSFIGQPTHRLLKCKPILVVLIDYMIKANLN